ncbi:MAG: DUF2304 family protein [Candidatus Moranbacteria bacterium]|nr:DUF2304 family protein [Candidatus Moranbacteria bacterium]
MIIKILTIIFIFFAASRAILRFKERMLSLQSLIFWMIIWTGILVIVFNPKISDDLAHALGINRGTDTAFFISIIALLYLVFRLYIKLDNIDNDITKLATEMSKKIHKDKLSK